MSETTPTARRVAVVVNPVKVSDDFGDLLRERATTAGWAEPLWLETSEEDPGHGMTREALDAEPDLVIAAGGDGTVRVVADGLADSGVTMAVVAAGTANLLARNLGLPLTEPEALDVAFAGRTQELDLVALTADGGQPQHFAVIAGIGVDAMIMDEVDPALKDKVGAAAYFVATAKALGRVPVPLQVRVDGGHRHRRRAMACLIGNVGRLPGGIDLIPQADAGDGLLDVYVASPRRLRHWLKLLLRIVSRRPQRDDQVDLWRGRRVEVQLGHPDSYQMDGDVAGQCRTLTAEIRPGALRVCIP